MTNVKELIQQGELTKACEILGQELKDDPLSTEKRALYVELLCVSGELEKADNQLDMMVRQNPDFLIGAVNLRQLIRAMQSRIDFYNGADTASIFFEADTELQTLLELRLALKEERFDDAQSIAHKLEHARKKTPVQINDEQYADVRDLDDSLCGYIELFGTDGKYYVTNFSNIDYLEIKAPESLIETVLRRVEVSIKDGPSGEAFLPVIYAESATPMELLGRETDWAERSDQLFTGVGQKMWLVGEQALAITDISSFACGEPAEAQDKEPEAV